MGRVPGQVFDARAEVREPRIGRLALHEAVVDLLNDHRDLEHREDLVVADARQIPTRARRISVDELFDDTTRALKLA